jgi:hypothetical protein
MSKAMSLLPAARIGAAILSFVVMASLAHPDSAQGVTRTFPIPGHGVLGLKIPKTWSDRFSQPEGDLPPTLHLGPDKGREFDALVTVLWSSKSDVDFNTEEAVTSQVEAARDQAIASAIQEAIPIRNLRGEQLVGKYFSATDRAPTADGFRYLTQGVAALSDLLLMFTILSNDENGTTVESVLEVLKGAWHSAASQPFVESGTVMEPTVGFSFRSPPEWQLDAKSRSGNLLLVHAATGSTFAIQLKTEAADVGTEFRGLKYAVPMLAISQRETWHRVGERWTKVGKLKAGGLESTSVHSDGKTWHEWHLLCVRKTQALLLSFSAPEAEALARRADLDQILASFDWPKK